MKVQPALLLCAFGAIGMLSLTGCGQPPASTTPDTTTSSPAPSTEAAQTSPSAPAQSGYPELVSVVTKTQDAVKASDFAAAQQEFDQFEGVWSQVEDGIKAKSAESYDAIEQDMDQITNALKSSESDKALAALQALNDHIQSIPQS